tara:strand:+ start:63 stop:1166 length:1104 start_codon:yes stop_codon:yes gene_type:complete
MQHKVLIVLPNDSLGGAEQVLKMIANYHLEKNDYINIFFLKKKSTNSWNDIAKYKNASLSFGNFNIEYLGLINLLFFVSKSSRFDRLYTSQVLISGFLGFVIKLKLLKVRFFIARESTSIFKRFTGFKLFIYNFFYFIGYSKIDLLICQTEFMKECLRKNLPFLFSKINIETIPNPINIEDIKQKEKDKIEDSIVNEFIVSAGRLITEKGFDVLINAFKIISKRDTGLKLIILGEGKERENLQNLINKYNLQNSIILRGYVKNVYPYFNKAKVCVVPSRIEGFPNVLLQMMSQNTKVVSTLCAGGIDDLDGVVTLPPNDSLLLSKSILEVLKSDTSKNKDKFRLELNKRSITSFIKTIDELLNEKVN